MTGEGGGDIRISAGSRLSWVWNKWESGFNIQTITDKRSDRLGQKYLMKIG